MPLCVPLPRRRLPPPPGPRRTPSPRARPPHPPTSSCRGPRLPPPHARAEHPRPPSAPPGSKPDCDATTGSRARDGNRVTLLFDGVASFAERSKMIDGAKESIHLQTFIFTSDDAGWALAKQLADKAKEGVKVRVIYDGVGQQPRRPEDVRDDEGRRRRGAARTATRYTVLGHQRSLAREAPHRRRQGLDRRRHEHRRRVRARRLGQAGASPAATDGGRSPGATST